MWAAAPQPSNDELHQKWLHNRLAHKTEKLITAMADDGVGDLDVFFRHLDQDAQLARHVYQEADKHLVLSRPVQARSFMHSRHQGTDQVVTEGIADSCNVSVDWEQVTQLMRSRGTEDCPICMLPLHKKRQAVGYSLLSCSHAFHLKCIESFEEFELARGGNPTCPICRNAYIRRALVCA